MSPWRRNVFFKIPIDGVSDAQSKGLTSAVCAMDLPNEFCKAHLPSDLEVVVPPEDAERGAGAQVSALMCFCIPPRRFRRADCSFSVPKIPYHHGTRAAQYWKLFV